MQPLHGDSAALRQVLPAGPRQLLELLLHHLQIVRIVGGDAIFRVLSDA